MYSDSPVTSVASAVAEPLSYCNSVISSFGQVALASSLASVGSSASCASYASAGLTPDPRILSCPVSQYSPNGCRWPAANHA